MEWSELPLDPPGLTTGSAEGASPGHPHLPPAATPTRLLSSAPSTCLCCPDFVLVAALPSFLLGQKPGSLHPRRPAKKDSEITEQRRRSGTTRITNSSSGILERTRPCRKPQLKANRGDGLGAAGGGRGAPRQWRRRRAWLPSGTSPIFSGEVESCPGFLQLHPRPPGWGRAPGALRRGSRGPPSRRRGWKEGSRARSRRPRGARHARPAAPPAGRALNGRRSGFRRGAGPCAQAAQRSGSRGAAAGSAGLRFRRVSADAPRAAPAQTPA